MSMLLTIRNTAPSRTAFMRTSKSIGTTMTRQRRVQLITSKTVCENVDINLNL